VFIENIRNGARGLDDLTNYVYAITNTWTLYTPLGTVGGTGVNGYTYTSFSVMPPYSSISSGAPLTNGANIIGLLSTPEYSGNLNDSPLTSLVSGGYSNYVVAYVHSLSGPAVEKPPQNNPILVGDSFGYKMICQNVPVAVYIPPLWKGQQYPAGAYVSYLLNGQTTFWRATANVSPSDLGPTLSSFWVQDFYPTQLTANLRELRLTFLWPLLPNGNVGNGRQTFRTTVAGQLVPTNVVPNNVLYFFQPQFFTTAP
jgi:hypothetical protein